MTLRNRTAVCVPSHRDPEGAQEAAAAWAPFSSHSLPLTPSHSLKTPHPSLVCIWRGWWEDKWWGFVKQAEESLPSQLGRFSAFCLRKSRFVPPLLLPCPTYRLTVSWSRANSAVCPSQIRMVKHCTLQPCGAPPCPQWTELCSAFLSGCSLSSSISALAQGSCWHCLHSVHSWTVEISSLTFRASHWFVGVCSGERRRVGDFHDPHVMLCPSPPTHRERNQRKSKSL